MFWLLSMNCSPSQIYYFSRKRKFLYTFFVFQYYFFWGEGDWLISAKNFCQKFPLPQRVLTEINQQIAKFQVVPTFLDKLTVREKISAGGKHAELIFADLPRVCMAEVSVS